MSYIIQTKERIELREAQIFNNSHLKVSIKHQDAYSSIGD